MKYYKIMKKVSIIISCHNKQDYISRAIDSALNQTYPNIEIIVINNASSDNSYKIINEYTNTNQNIIFISENWYMPESKSKNTAIAAASGEYIFPLNAEDTIEPEFIEQAIKLFEKKQNIDFIYTNVRNIKNNKKIKNISPDKILFENYIKGSAIFKKSDFEKSGCYKEWLKEDFENWDLYLSFTEKGLKSFKINEYLYNKQIKKNNLTKNIKYNLYSELIKNHLSLYSDNENFIKKLFDNSKIKNLYKIIYFLVFIIIIEFILFYFFIK